MTSLDSFSTISIDQRIQSMVDSRRLSIDEVATKTGLRASRVKRLLSGKRPFDPKSLSAFAKALQLSEAILLGDAPEPQEEPQKNPQHEEKGHKGKADEEEAIQELQAARKKRQQAQQKSTPKTHQQKPPQIPAHTRRTAQKRAPQNVGDKEYNLLEDEYLSVMLQLEELQNEHHKLLEAFAKSELEISDLEQENARLKDSAKSDANTHEDVLLELEEENDDLRQQLLEGGHGKNAQNNPQSTSKTRNSFILSGLLGLGIERFLQDND